MSLREDLLAELEGTADVHAIYLEQLEQRGFTRDEAFQLVRDHHACFTWYALVHDKAPPGWLSAPTSNESSLSTVPSLRVLRPDTSEQ